MRNNLLVKLVHSDILHFIWIFPIFGTAQQTRKATTSLIVSVRPSFWTHTLIQYYMTVGDKFSVCIFEQAYQTRTDYYPFNKF